MGEFTNATIATAKRNIPRDFRKNYKLDSNSKNKIVPPNKIASHLVRI